MFKTTAPALLALALTLTPLAGCGDDNSQANNDYPNGVAPIDGDAAEQTPTPGDGLHGRDVPDPDADTPGTRSAQGLVYTVPAGWSVGGPRQMRALTLDAGDGVEVAVAKWPGDVGGYESNLTRWLGQAGYNPADAAAIQQVRNGFATINVGDTESTWIPLLDGDGGSPMIAVWIPRGQETWTFKIIGDAETLRSKQDELRAWAESLSFE